MSFVTPVDGQPAVAEHVAQLTETFKGNRSIPISIVNNLLMGGSGTPPIIRVTENDASRLSLRSTAGLDQTSAGYTSIGGNGYSDGSLWQRYNVGQDSSLYQASPAGHAFYVASAGSNPIGAWTQKLGITASGVTPYGHLLFGADDTYNIGAPSSGRPNTVHVSSFVSAPAILAPTGVTFGFGANGFTQWRITTAGHLAAITDNIQDIGVSNTANRPRDLWLGRNLRANGTVYFPSFVGIGIAPTAGTHLYVNPNGLTGTTQYTMQVLLTPNTLGTAKAVGVYVMPWQGTGVTTAETACFWADALLNTTAGAVWTNAYGLYVGNQGAGGGYTTNATGVMIKNQTGATTTNVGLKNEGTSWLQGQVDIGANATAANRPFIRTPATHTPSVSVESPAGMAFLSGGNAAFLDGNAYYDGSNWNRYNVATPATRIIADASGNIYFQAVPAGANPIAWGTPTTTLDINGTLTVIKPVKLDTGWHAITSFLNGFTAYDPPWPVEYMIDAAGTVHFRGLLQSPGGWSGAAMLPAFNLPAGYRISVNATADYQHFFALSENAGFGEIIIYKGGNVVPYMAGNGTTTGAHWWDMTCISFSTMP